ncbi:MliC family protein [Paracoccus panacisoli]|uniref:MliC family protein n=1 Tax=Paracoccus panacisoli TaxID=1510163 RepID=A0ABV6T3J8_9RHOB
MRTSALILAALCAAAPALAETPAPAAAPAAEAAAAAATTPPSTEPAPGDSIEAVSYACAGNKILHAVFVNTAGGSSFATILQQDELIPMQIAVSASGARYTAINPDYTYELVTKGDSADLYATTNGKEERVLEDCTASN